MADPRALHRLHRLAQYYRGYLAGCAGALLILLVFGEQLGLLSADDWGTAGIVAMVLIAPILLFQRALRCPTCGARLNGPTRLSLPGRCASCGDRLT